MFFQCKLSTLECQTRNGHGCEQGYSISQYDLPFVEMCTNVDKYPEGPWCGRKDQVDGDRNYISGEYDYCLAGCVFDDYSCVSTGNSDIDSYNIS